MRYLIGLEIAAFAAVLAITVCVGSVTLAQAGVTMPNSGVTVDHVVGSQSAVPVVMVKHGSGGSGGGRSMHSGSGHSMHHRGGNAFFFGLYAPLYGFPYSNYSEGSPVGQPTCVWNGYKYTCYDPAGNAM
jgi:hypothetical protein